MKTKTVPPTFAQLGLAAPVLKAIEDVGYEAPSPIQAEAIPPLLAGRDLLGQAQTGTGKTGAFALPLLSRLDLALAQPQLLVLTPTRELAIQVAEAMQTYARHLEGFHVLPVYGGQSMEAQLRQLGRGMHAVVGTPGRIQDHLRRGTLKLDRLVAVVLDEADEMLRMGFIDDVRGILEHTPPARQIALFSATMPPAIRKVANEYLRDPVVIKVKSATATVSTVTQRYWEVAGVHKLTALTRILEVEDFDAMLIFVRTKNATVELSEKLEARGFACAPLSGDLTQALRERTVERLKGGALDIVVATDVAARGLHVERISHVVNYDVPYDTEAYVHRIGRTARAGREGQAILFVAPRELRMLRAIERATGQPIAPMRLPSGEDIAGRRIAQFKRAISEVIDAQDLEPFAAVVDEYREEHDTDPSEIAAALAYLVQKHRPFRPAASEEPAPPPPPKAAAARPSAAAARPSAAAARPSAEAGRPSAEAGRPSAEAGRRPAARPRGDAAARRYRIEVGLAHGAQPSHIVGAIANEIGLPSKRIGAIQIFDAFSIVELPADLPAAALQHLQKVRVRGRRLNVTPVPAGGRAAPAHKPRHP